MTGAYAPGESYQGTFLSRAASCARERNSSDSPRTHTISTAGDTRWAWTSATIVSAAPAHAVAKYGNRRVAETTKATIATTMVIRNNMYNTLPFFSYVRSMGDATQWTQRLVDLYAETVSDHLVKHHIDSYNQYVRQRIGDIIRQFNPHNTVTTPDGAYVIRVLVGGKDGERLHFKRPQIRTPDGKASAMTPQLARELGLSYTFRVSADVLVQYEARPSGDVAEKWFEGVHVMSVPILLRSDMCVLAGKSPELSRALDECPFDPGAYFIIDGKEKVIVSQEKLADHKLITTWNREDRAEPLLRVAVRATSEEDRLFPKNHVFHVNHADHKQFPYGIYVTPPIMRKKSGLRVPVAVMFKALGVLSDRDMLAWVLADEPTGLEETAFTSVFKAGHAVRTRQDALQYLARLGDDTPGRVESEIERDFLPHAGRDLVTKAAVLGGILRDVMAFLATGKHVDRDALTSKRVDVSGFLLTYVTRDMIYRWRKAALYGIVASYQNGTWRNSGDVRLVVNSVNLTNIFSDKQIDRAMIANFKINKRWAIRKNATDQEAIVQDLKRVSFIGTVSHLRRVNTPLSDKTKAVAPHSLHSTHWGVMCPSETPDGASIGLLKHLSMLCFVTYDCGNAPIRSVLVENCGMTTLDRMCVVRRQRWDVDVSVLLNNVWIGVLTPDEDAVAVCEYLRLLRRNGMINCMTSIGFHADTRTLAIGTEQGRCARPLLVVRDGSLLLRPEHVAKCKTWWDLVVGRGNDPYKLEASVPHGKRAFSDAALLRKLRKSACPVEYVDVDEATTTLVAMYPRDVTSRHTHCEIHPMAILSWTAANLALIHHNPAPRVLNACGQSKQAIGVHASSFRRRFDTEAYVMCYPHRPLILSSMSRHCRTTRLPGGQNLMTMIAAFTGYNQEDAIIVNRAAIDRGCLAITAYHTLVHSETSKADGGLRFYDPAKDAISGDASNVDASGVIRPGSRVKFDTVTAAMRTETRDASVADNMFGGVVDRTQMRVDDATGLRTASVVVRDFRSCTVGDKLASRFYNKGVVGMVLPEHDMPWMADGTVPDIIINPHAFPSRMTVGQLIELCASLLCCQSGAGITLAPLDPVSDRVMHTVSREGAMNAVAYSPSHGRHLEADVGFGCAHYIRMKQQVVDKVASRGYGRVDNVTFQPVRGRSNEGGLKLGGMETAAIVSHGLSSFLTEASMQKADGQLMRTDADGTVPHQSSQTKTLALPRAFATLTHEMRTGLGVDVRLAYGA